MLVRCVQARHGASLDESRSGPGSVGQEGRQQGWRRASCRASDEARESRDETWKHRKAWRWCGRDQLAAEAHRRHDGCGGEDRGQSGDTGSNAAASFVFDEVRSAQRRRHVLVVKGVETLISAGIRPRFSPHDARCLRTWRPCSSMRSTRALARRDARRFHARAGLLAHGCRPRRLDRSRRDLEARSRARRTELAREPSSTRSSCEVAERHLRRQLGRNAPDPRAAPREQARGDRAPAALSLAADVVEGPDAPAASGISSVDGLRVTPIVLRMLDDPSPGASCIGRDQRAGADDRVGLDAQPRHRVPMARWSCAAVHSP